MLGLTAMPASTVMTSDAGDNEKRGEEANGSDSPFDTVMNGTGA
jgi:hypothetical protein